MRDSAVVQLLTHLSIEGLAVLAVLAAMSIASLAVILAKTLEFRRRAGYDAQFADVFRRVKHFNDLPVAVSRCTGEGLRTIAEAALVEEEALSPEGEARTRSELVQEAAERSAEEERARLEEKLWLLVVVAASGPFLGLLGTVWGIMDAFFAIGKTGSANLNVVAPGIAEALLTTLAGLLVALPAAAAHQFLSSRVRRIESDYLVFASRIGSLFRRGLLPNQG